MKQLIEYGIRICSNIVSHLDVFMAVLIIILTLFLCLWVFKKPKNDAIKSAVSKQRPSGAVPPPQPPKPKPAPVVKQPDSARDTDIKNNPEIIIKIPDTIDGCQIAYRYEDVSFTATGDIYKIDDIGKRLDLVPTGSACEVRLDQNQIGVLTKVTLCNMVRDFQNRGEPVYAAFSNFSADERLGYMHLLFYRNQLDYYRSRQPDALAYKLSTRGNAEMADYLPYCSVGDVLTLEYDGEKERYFVADPPFTYGYLPASAEKFIETHGPESIVPIVFSNDCDGNGKPDVRVALFLK